ALAGLLQFVGLLGVPGSGDGGQATRTEFEALRAEVAAIAQRPATDAGTERMDELATALETVRADVAALGQRAGGVDPADLQALEERMKAVEDAVARLGQQGDTAQPETQAELT